MKIISIFKVIIILFFLINCNEPQKREINELSSQEQKENNDLALVKNYLSAGKEFFHRKKYSEAIDQFQNANTITPTEEGYYLLGLSYLRKDEFSFAKESFISGLEINPNHEQILSAYAICLTALGEEEKTIEIYSRLIENYPQSDIYIFKKGVALKTLSRFSEAYVEFNKLNLNEFKLQTQLLMHLGDVSFELRKYPESEEYYAQAKLKNPKLVEAEVSRLKAKEANLVEIGTGFYDKKNYQEASKYFTNAVNINSKSPEANWKLGKTYFQLNQLESAEERINISLRYNENNREAYMYLAKIYEHENKIRSSIINYKNAIKNFPVDTELYNLLGLSYKKLSNNSLAILSFIQAREIDEKYLEARKNLALTQLEENQILEAKREVLELYELYPENNEIKEIKKDIDSLDESSKKNKWNKNLPYREGLAYEEKNEWSKAQKFYSTLKNKNQNLESVDYRVAFVNSKINELNIIRKIESSSSFKKGEMYQESKNYSGAIQQFLKLFEKYKHAIILQKIIDLYLELGQKEKSLSFLKKVSIESSQNQELHESVAVYYLKLGQESIAEKYFKEILEIFPESAISYYQLGIISLGHDRKKALGLFEKAIAVKKQYASAYIARGINYYKLGNRDRAREDFRYALSMESNLEIASYNLGMILYNDNLYNDAETIFLDLTNKYPKFADPFYHLGFIYFEQKKYPLAEKYILNSLKIERKPITIYAYIKILEEINKTKQTEEKTNVLILNLKKEIVEKYPNSSYAKTLTKSVMEDKKNRVVIQRYPVGDRIITEPIYINQSVIVNYGGSIARLDSNTKSVLWRVEVSDFYKRLKANSRVYGLSKNQLDQYDLETGKLLWRVKLGSNSVKDLFVSDSILYSINNNGRQSIVSYSIEGELQKTIDLLAGSIWEVTPSGNLYVFQNSNDGVSWKIYNSKLEPLRDDLTLLGENEELKIIGSTDFSCYVMKGKHVFRFEPSGAFSRSSFIRDTDFEFYLNKNVLYMKTNSYLYSFHPSLNKVELVQDFNLHGKEIYEENNTHLSSSGLFKMRDQTGKLLWSENLSQKIDKNKFEIFSVYYK